MAETKFDVAIIGAGPAGATAAILLARKDRKVVLIDRDKGPRAVACAGWLGAKAKSLLEELGCAFADGVVTPFSHVKFHNSDFTKSASPKLDGPVGYLVDRTRFDAALVAQAKSLGATLVLGEEAKDVRLGETTLTVQCASASIESRLLILATGRSQALAARAGFVARSSDSPTWVVQVEATIKGEPQEPQVEVILGLDTRGSFGFFSSNGTRATLSVNFLGNMAPAVPALVRLCKLTAERGMMPEDLSTKAAQMNPIRCPAGWALDMDTHVAKHTLLVGDAGGFVSAASNEGLYPAMWSARIAAEVIDKALQSPYSQDELMSFDSQWRMQIADHLRSPHTDIRFLLPLIFTNQAMADRMAGAFFFGDNI